jgi:hypothetical protein
VTCSLLPPSQCATLYATLGDFFDNWSRSSVLYFLLAFIVNCKYIYIHTYIYIYTYISCGAAVWTEGIHLEPLHQPFFGVCDGFFQDRVSRTICLGWIWTMILLIAASWVARITGMNHWHLAWINFLTSCFLVAYEFEPTAFCLLGASAQPLEPHPAL